MAVVPLQSSNVFSYTFAGQGNTHTHYLVAGNNNPVLNIGGQSWTIECWLKPTGIYSNYNSVFSKRRTTGSTKGTDVSYLGGLDTTTGYVLYFDGGGGANYSTTRLTSNAWSHVAWVFNQGSNVRIFVNGTNVATNAAVTSVANIDSQFFIGLNPGQNSQYFGDISNFRIVLGQALYSGESFNVSTFPMQLPNNAIGPHVGGSNVAASLTGNVVLLTCNDQVIKSNGNATINGTSTNSGLSIVGTVHPHVVDTTELQHYSFANFSPSRTANSAQTSGSFMLTTDSTNLNIPSGNFTIECWAYLTSDVAVGSGAGGDFIQRGGAINIAWPSFAITAQLGNVYFAGSNTNARMDIGGDGSNGVGGNVHRGFIGTIQPNVWNHIAVTRSGTTYYGFLNGVLGYTETTANTPYNSTGRGIVMMGGFQNATNTWTAGGMSTKNFNGYITDARISKTALYTTNFTPPNTPLQLLPTTVFLLKGPGNPVDAAGSVTISSNGTGALFFSTNNPYTANAVANADETTLSTLNNATGRRQERIYDKLDVAEFSMSGPIFPELGRRQERIYDKLDVAEFAMSSAIFLELGRRQERIYDKLDTAEYIASVPLYNDLGARQDRIYSKFDTVRYAYIPIGTGDGTGGGAANVEYEFWS